MNETLTVTVGHASLYVAVVAAIAGFAVLVAVRGLLTTAIEGARLVARNDEQAARWLWKRGYRSTPHAGPDITDDVPAIEDGSAVNAEVVAVSFPTQELRLAGAELADEVGDEQPGEAASGLLRHVKTALDAFDRAWRWVARGVGYGIEWAAYQLKSERQREAEFTETYHRELESAREEEPSEVEERALLDTAWAAANPPTNPQPEPVQIVRVNHRYRRPGDTGLFPLVKVVGDKAAGRHRAEPEMPAINVPAQRTGDEA